MVALTIFTVPDFVNVALFGGSALLAARLLLSVFVLMMFLVPIALWSGKNRVSPLVVGLIIILICAALTAITWMDGWVFIVIILFIAAMLARTFGLVLTGGGSTGT